MPGLEPELWQRLDFVRGLQSPAHGGVAGDAAARLHETTSGLRSHHMSKPHHPCTCFVFLETFWHAQDLYRCGMPVGDSSGRAGGRWLLGAVQEAPHHVDNHYSLRPATQPRQSRKELRELAKEASRGCREKCQM